MPIDAITYATAEEKEAIAATEAYCALHDITEFLGGTFADKGDVMLSSDNTCTRFKLLECKGNIIGAGISVQHTDNWQRITPSLPVDKFVAHLSALGC
jgi:hypothetical protein